MFLFRPKRYDSDSSSVARPQGSSVTWLPPEISYAAKFPTNMPKISRVSEVNENDFDLMLSELDITDEQTLGEIHRVTASLKAIRGLQIPYVNKNMRKEKIIAEGPAKTIESTEEDIPSSSQGEKFARQVRALTRIAAMNNSAKNNRCTIYPIPHEIRSCDPESYEPISVCIGPHFYAKRCMANLNQLQDYKWRCVNKLIVTSNIFKQQQISDLILIQRLLDKIKELEPIIRDSYMMKFDLSSDELALIMMLDGCFILHLLLKHALGETRTVDEDWTQVTGRCWIWNLVRYDLLLLENQIPFFVITTIFDILNPKIYQSNDILIAGALKLFSTLYPCKKDTNFSINIKQVHHLLHLVYLSILPSTLVSRSNNNRLTLSELPNWVPSAKELSDAGIKFKNRRTFSCFLDIKFSNGTLEIPNIQVYDYSKILFRNFIAFEQCYPDTRAHVTTYAAFMDCLLNTPEDMRLLHLSGVIVNRMTTDQYAVNFFSHLCNQVHYASDQNYLLQTIIDVNKYHNSKWHKWRAGLARDYFSNPWVIISLFLAGFLLFLTMTQTFFATYSYFKPP